MIPGVKRKRGGMLPSFLAFINPEIHHEVRAVDRISRVVRSVVIDDFALAGTIRITVLGGHLFVFEPEVLAAVNK